MDWKQSHITPIHKGGSTDDPRNYHPIAAVPIVAKILEKIIATQLVIIFCILTKELINLVSPQKIFYSNGYNYWMKEISYVLIS